MWTTTNSSDPPLPSAPPERQRQRGFPVCQRQPASASWGTCQCVCEWKPSIMEQTQLCVLLFPTSRWTAVLIGEGVQSVLPHPSFSITHGHGEEQPVSTSQLVLSEEHSLAWEDPKGPFRAGPLGAANNKPSLARWKWQHGPPTLTAIKPLPG